MRERARFVLVTDDIDYALADVFASVRSNAPSWARVTDDPADILALPDGCKVHFAVWRSARGTSGAEMAWRERRQRGGLEFLSDEEMEKIAVWRARRAGQGSGTPIDAKEAAGVAAASSQAASSSIQQWT